MMFMRARWKKKWFYLIKVNKYNIEMMATETTKMMVVGAVIMVWMKLRSRELRPVWKKIYTSYQKM